MRTSRTVILSALMAALCTACWLGWNRYLGAGRDDVFLTLWSGECLAAGKGLINHNGVAVEISSSILHTWVVAALAWADIMPLFLANKLFGLLALLGTLVFMAIACSRSLHSSNSDVTGMLFVLATVSTTPSLLYWSMGGLETSIAVFLWTALPLTLAHVERESARNLAASVLGVLLVLVRPEGYLILSLIMILVTAAQRGTPYSRLLIRPWIVWSGVFFAVSTWRLSSFGSIWPNPVLAKAAPSLESLSRGLRYALGFYTSSALVFALGVAFGVRLVMLVRARTRDYRSTVLVSTLLALHLFVITTGGDWMEHHRFLQPALPLLTLSLADQLDEVLPSRSRFTRLGIASSLLILVLLNLGQRSAVDSGTWTMESTARAGLVDADDLDSRAKLSNSVYARDAADLFPFFEEHLLGLEGSTEEPLVLATPQMGQLPYFLRSRFPEVTLELVDTRGLCEPDLAALDVARGAFGLEAGADLAGILGGAYGPLSDAVRARRPNLLYRVREPDEGIRKLEELGFELVHRSDRAMVFFRSEPWPDQE